MTYSNFTGTARPLQSLEISKIAASIGCTEDHLHAVMEVETRGGGFDSQGRIKMLFEPHIFYRELTGRHRELAVKKGLAYPRWGTKKYPKDSYPRLHEAQLIDRDAALRACSWGLGQIMGFNCKLAGYATAHAMVQDFKHSEETHLRAMVEFIKTSNLDDELRRADWAGFARGYNGPGYAKHRYHLKLERAYLKWKKIPDTPFEIDRSEPDVNEFDFHIPQTSLRPGAFSPAVRVLQNRLIQLGYTPGSPDGAYGNKTRAAVLEFQKKNGLSPDGIAGAYTVAALNNKTKAVPNGR